MKSPSSAAPIPLPAELCAELVTASEDLVGGVLSGHHGWLSRTIRQPVNSFGVVAAGVEQMMLVAIKFILLASAGSLAIAVARHVTLIEEAQVTPWVYAWSTLSFLVFALPIPFRQAAQFNLRSRVERASKCFASIEQVTSHNIADVRACLDRVERATAASATVLWWMPAVAWAAGVYLVQRGLDKADGSLLGAAFVPFLFAALGAFVLAAHRRGCALVYAVAHGVLHLRGQALSTVENSAGKRAGRISRIRPKANRKSLS